MATPFLIALAMAQASATPAPAPATTAPAPAPAATTPAPAAATPAPATRTTPVAPQAPVTAPATPADPSATPADPSATPAEAQPPVNATATAEAVPATPTDLVVGATVRGSDRQPVGTIETADGQSATVVAGTARARLPLNNFRKDGEGLLIAVTRAQFEQAVGGQRSGGSN